MRYEIKTTSTRAETKESKEKVSMINFKIKQQIIYKVYTVFVRQIKSFLFSVSNNRHQIQKKN